MTALERLLADFATFSRLQIETLDIDPAYPVLRRFFDLREMDEEARLWALSIYVTCYNLGTTERLLAKYPRPAAVEAEPIITGVERRAMRGDGVKMASLLSHIAQCAPLSPFFGEAIAYGWDAARLQFESFPWCGSWSSYKWADLLLNVMDVPIEATSVAGGLGDTAGPIPTMSLLTGVPLDRCAAALDVQIALLDRCRKAGAPMRGLDQLETCLCDFGSLLKGHYYVGHDTDLMMSQIPPASGFWQAREALPEEMRGERRDWFGLRRERLRWYADAGRLS